MDDEQKNCHCASKQSNCRFSTASFEVLQPGRPAKRRPNVPYRALYGSRHLSDLIS